MAGIKDYSTTPGNNTSINGISIAEGCPIANWNNAVRQLMADVRSDRNSAEWFAYGDGDGAVTISYASATSFTIAGADVTSIFHAGRAVKANGTLTGTIYGLISSSSFSTDTTVNVTWNSGSLSNESLTIWIGILSKSNDSLPSSVPKATQANTWSAAQTFSATAAMSGAAFNEAAEVDVASAATTNIGAAASNSVRITGTTTITAFDTVSAGITRRVRFAGALTLTHNGTSLILPGAANITTAAGDEAEFTSLGSGNWVCRYYQKADGTPTGGMATQADMEAATDTTKPVTAGRVRFSPYATQVWGKIEYTAGVPSVVQGKGISSLTDNGTGDFTVNFTNAFSAATYAFVIGGARTGSSATPVTAQSEYVTPPTTSACRFLSNNPGVNGGADINCGIAFFGDLP